MWLTPDEESVAVPVFLEMRVVDCPLLCDSRIHAPFASRDSTVLGKGMAPWKSQG